tara:strand:+ start:667 stop:861 length:195 start_codon:yes stop_codon:yes gene_type:complete
LEKKASCDKDKISKSLADTSETLLGDVYKATNSMEHIHAWYKRNRQKTAVLVFNTKTSQLCSDK